MKHAVKDNTRKSDTPGIPAGAGLRSSFSIFIFLLVVRGMALGDLVVDPSGSGNYPTIQAAVDAAFAGDIISIKAGTYAELVRFPRSGTAQAPITLRPFGDGEVVVDGQDGRAEVCMAAQGVSYLSIKGLTLRGASLAGFYAEAPAAGITLEGLTIENIVHPQSGVGYGIYFYALPKEITNCHIRGCVIRHTSSDGILLYGRNLRTDIRNCLISFSGFQDGAWGHAVETVVWNEDGPHNGPSDITIEDNELANAWVQGIVTWNAKQLLFRRNHIHHCGATGIQIEDGTSGFVIEDNLSEWNQQHYSTETGIWVDDASDGIVRNNVILHNQVGIKVGKSGRIIVRNNIIQECRRENPQQGDNGGIYLLAYDGVDNRDTVVVQNTVSGVGTPGLLNLGFAVCQYDSARNLDALFLNNILTGVTDGYDYYWLSLGTLSDYNTVYNPNGIRVYLRRSESSWEDFRAASGQEEHSITADPLLEFPAEGFCSLPANSPAVDAGTPLTRTLAAGLGTALAVEDSRPFTDGFGLVKGDWIMIGGSAGARIAAVDHANGVLTLDRSLAWQAGDPVSLPYGGNAPDMGAVEFSPHGRPVSRP